MIAAGTRVRVRCTNGGLVEGRLIADSSMEYGSRYPVLRDDRGWLYSFRYSFAEAPSGQTFSPIAGAESMEALVGVPIEDGDR
jgi:hypothetical protein